MAKVLIRYKDAGIMEITDLTFDQAKEVANISYESAAVALGRKGGQVTAKRGSEYFRTIASMRKNRKGGRSTDKRINRLA